MEERIIVDTKRFFSRNDLDKKLKPLMEKAVAGDGDSQFSVANQILEIVNNTSSKLYMLWMEEAALNNCVMAQYLLAEDKNIEDRYKYYTMLVNNEKTPLQVYDYSLNKLADLKYDNNDMTCIAMYEELIADMPQNKLAHYRLADLYLRNNDKDKAKKMFTKYKKLCKMTLNYCYSDPLDLKTKLK